MIILEVITASQLVPALMATNDSGVERIIVGKRGQTHADVFTDRERELENFPNIDGGFFDTENKQYLTRREAYRIISNNKKEFPLSNTNSPFTQLASHELNIVQQAEEKPDGVYGTSNF